MPLPFLVHHELIFHKFPAANQGKRFLYRTGAAFVSARLGINPKPPLPSTELQMDFTAGGLIIAGSYVSKTTQQLDTLRKRSGDALTTIILEVDRLLSSQEAAQETVTNALRIAEAQLVQQQDVLVMTSRKLVDGGGGDAIKSLDIGSKVAAALVSFLQQLTIRPRYIIAKVRKQAEPIYLVPYYIFFPPPRKPAHTHTHTQTHAQTNISTPPKPNQTNPKKYQGGITSSDMATKGLRMKRATVTGQALAGVPIWRCEEQTCKFPGLPFVVFPGNVGSGDALYRVVDGFRKERREGKGKEWEVEV